jgi:hypothetical protein
MAKVDLNPSFHSVSGALGAFVYRKVRGQTIMTARPKRDGKKRKPSAAQIAQRKRFAAAGDYVRKVLADPWQRRVYEALGRERNRRADKLVASDFLTPPVVDEIELSGYRGRAGDLIRVLATDDIEVVSVQVTIDTAKGARVEAGPATKVHGVWRYTTTAAAPAGEPLVITATAKDRPGHDGTRRESYP